MLLLPQDHQICKLYSARNVFLLPQQGIILSNITYPEYPQAIGVGHYLSLHHVRRLNTSAGIVEWRQIWNNWPSLASLILMNEKRKNNYKEQGRKEMFYLTTHSTHFYLRLYGVRHMVKDHSDSEIRNPLPPHRLLFPSNTKGSFICTIPQKGLHIPQPLLHQSWSTDWNEK